MSEKYLCTEHKNDIILTGSNKYGVSRYVKGGNLSWKIKNSKAVVTLCALPARSPWAPPRWALPSPLLSAYDSAKAETTIEAPAHPFTYQKLDPTATLERGYKSFFELGGCAAGAFDAIIGQLADLVGYPLQPGSRQDVRQRRIPGFALRPCAVPGRLRRRHRPAVRARGRKDHSGGSVRLVP